MVCFRAPSPSLGSVGPVPDRNTRGGQDTKAQKSHATVRRARRGHKLDKTKAAVKEAAKRAHKTKKLVEPCNAYVGNIGPDMDENALLRHFSCCGKILSVRIHCCGGVVMTVKPPPSSYHENMRVRQYAIITFESKLARQRACKLETTLGGRKLIVSILVSDLPEVQEKITKRLEEYRLRQDPVDVHRAHKSALKSLKLEPTAPVEGGDGRRRRRNCILGYSLFEGIM